jgi:hypothetical protein
VAPVEPLGQSISVAGSTDRPPLEITAEDLVVTRSKVPEMHSARGHLLLAVELGVRNLGDSTWVSEPGTSIVLRDQDLASYRTAAEFTEVQAGRVLPQVIRLRPGKTIRGFMVFEVPRRTTITQLELSVGPEAPRTARWSVDD